MKKRKQIKFKIFLWSDMAQKYCPTLWPVQNTQREAHSFAFDHLKLEQNRIGKSSFEIRKVLV